MSSAVVVGAGLGGLSAAIRLALEGLAASPSTTRTRSRAVA